MWVQKIVRARTKLVQNQKRAPIHDVLEGLDSANRHSVCAVACCLKGETSLVLKILPIGRLGFFGFFYPSRDAVYHRRRNDVASHDSEPLS